MFQNTTKRLGNWICSHPAAKVWGDTHGVWKDRNSCSQSLQILYTNHSSTSSLHIHSINYWQSSHHSILKSLSCYSVPKLTVNKSVRLLIAELGTSLLVSLPRRHSISIHLGYSTTLLALNACSRILLQKIRVSQLIHNNSPLVHILSKPNSVHTLPFSLRLMLLKFSDLYLGL